MLHRLIIPIRKGLGQLIAIALYCNNVLQCLLKMVRNIAIHIAVLVTIEINISIVLLIVIGIEL